MRTTSLLGCKLQCSISKCPPCPQQQIQSRVMILIHDSFWCSVHTCRQWMRAWLLFSNSVIKLRTTQAMLIQVTRSFAQMQTVDDTLLSRLLPTISAGLEKGASRDYQAATLIMVAELCCRATLGKDFVKGVCFVRPEHHNNTQSRSEM